MSVPSHATPASIASCKAMSREIGEAEREARRKALEDVIDSGVAWSGADTTRPNFRLTDAWLFRRSGLRIQDLDIEASKCVRP